MQMVGFESWFQAMVSCTGGIGHEYEECGVLLLCIWCRVGGGRWVKFPAMEMVLVLRKEAG